jgi:hypothetical protein
MSNGERVVNQLTGKEFPEVALSPRLDDEVHPYMYRPDQVLCDVRDIARMADSLAAARFRPQQEPREIWSASKSTSKTKTDKADVRPSDRRRQEIEQGIVDALPALGLERWVRDSKLTAADGDHDEVSVPDLVRSLRGTHQDALLPLRIWPVYVAHGEPDGEFGPATTAEPVVNAGVAPQGNAGKGVRVGVVDTGLYRKHEWLQQRATSRGVQDDEILDDNNDGKADFEASHGSFIAGVILRHAPGAVVIARAALDSHGIVDDTAIATAILSLLEEDIDILNLSLGGYTDPLDPLPFPATFRAIGQLRERNSLLVVVAAAGNKGRSQEFWPAAAPDVIGVGALTTNLRRASFSNFGPWVDAWANGVDVESCYMLDDQDTATGAIWSGTSFAAPRVAGAIAAAMNPA